MPYSSNGTENLILLKMDQLLRKISAYDRFWARALQKAWTKSGH